MKLPELNKNDKHNGMTQPKRLRRAGLLLSTVATAAIAGPTVVDGVASAVGDSFKYAADRIGSQTDQLPIVPANSLHKDIVLGETYTRPNGSKITPTDLWGVAQAANISDVSLQVEVDMLTREAQARNIDLNNLQPGTTLYVQAQAQVGSIYHPE